MSGPPPFPAGGSLRKSFGSVNCIRNSSVGGSEFLRVFPARRFSASLGFVDYCNLEFEIWNSECSEDRAVGQSRFQISTLFESYVIPLDQRQETCSDVNLILGKSLSLFHNVVQSSGLKIL
jgi:hypothetical protein